MGLVLAIVFLAVPIAELYVIVQVSHGIGVLNTLAVLVAVSLVGAWLVKHEGLAVLRRFQEQVHEGRVPTREIIDGFLVLFAGALLLTPGFLTDALGVLLLFPPIRALVRVALARRFKGQVRAYGFDLGGRATREDGRRAPSGGRDDIIDV